MKNKLDEILDAVINHYENEGHDVDKPSLNTDDAKAAIIEWALGCVPNNMARLEPYGDDASMGFNSCAEEVRNNLKGLE